MFGSGISFEALQECLLRVEPVELQGMCLLQAHPPTTGLFPQNVPRVQVKEALIELVQYTERCNTVAHRLRNLTPVPLLTVDQWEFGL